MRMRLPERVPYPWCQRPELPSDVNVYYTSVPGTCTRLSDEKQLDRMPVGSSADALSPREARAVVA
jgi:hypothetical protein